MSKGLEALERLKMFPIYQEIKKIPQQFRDKESINTDLSIIEKELKVLEFLKECLIIEDKGSYIEIACEFSIPNKKVKEKYDLLKEVLL